MIKYSTRSVTLRGALSSLLLLMSVGGCGESQRGALGDDWAAPPSTAAIAGRDGFLEDYGLACTARISDGNLMVELRNDGAHDVRVFAWNTPWDTKSDALKVSDALSGEESRYLGPVLNRTADGSSYLSLPARQKIHASYPITQSYSLKPGATSRVALRRSTFSLSVDGEPREVAHRCGEGRLKPSAEQVGRSSEALLQPESSCTASQKASIQRMIDGALRAAARAKEDFDHHNNHPIKRWFGNLSTNPRAAFARMLSEDEVVRCGGSPCDEDDWGVVMDYLVDNKLYVCPPIYSLVYASADQPGNQVGVLVHELAHLVDQPAGNIPDFENPSCVGYEDNACYGFQNALQLPTHCTDCAQRNADNYKFFAMQAFMRPALLAASQ